MWNGRGLEGMLLHQNLVVVAPRVWELWLIAQNWMSAPRRVFDRLDGDHSRFLVTEEGPQPHEARKSVVVADL